MSYEYKRKTRDRWDVESFNDGNWSVECSKYSWNEAKEIFQELKNKGCGEQGLRIKKRKEKKDEKIKNISNNHFK